MIPNPIVEKLEIIVLFLIKVFVSKSVKFVLFLESFSSTFSFSFVFTSLIQIISEFFEMSCTGLHCFIGGDKFFSLKKLLILGIKFLKPFCSVYEAYSFIFKSGDPFFLSIFIFVFELLIFFLFELFILS